MLQTRTPRRIPRLTHVVETEESEKSQPLGELKKEALVFFRKWKSNVLQRFTEINVNDMTAELQVLMVGAAVIVGCTVLLVAVVVEEEGSNRSALCPDTS
ncbi:hypothetical protein J3459_011512 [Metarhizium acridum]|nr:hypothetical protein J3459_011512 [Metarhizium acridum]